jgi:hypothetical protein
MGKPWSAPTSWDEVVRRAAGRRKYHALRRFQRALRRQQVAELLTRYGLRPGVRARIARELGVSQATISRDVKAVEESMAPCPCCGSLVPREQLGWA